MSHGILQAKNLSHLKTMHKNWNINTYPIKAVICLTLYTVCTDDLKSPKSSHKCFEFWSQDSHLWRLGQYYLYKVLILSVRQHEELFSPSMMLWELSVSKRRLFYVTSFRKFFSYLLYIWWSTMRDLFHLSDWFSVVTSLWHSFVCVFCWDWDFDWLIKE